MNVLKRLNESFEEIILVVFLVLISVVMGIQIVARLFNNPLSWSEEVARFLFVWSGFLSISYCLKKQISIKIEQVVEKLPSKVHAVIKILEKVIMLVFYLYMIQFAYDYFARAIASGQVSPAMQLPMYIVQFAPLFGFILTIIRLIEGLVIQFQMLFRKETEGAV